MSPTFARGGAGISLSAMDAATVPRATREEKDRLLTDFGRYCAIASVSCDERAMADAVTADLRGIGLEVAEDRTGDETGSNAGNLLARIDGSPGSRTILLCAHLDTVPLDAPVEVALRGEDDRWFENANEAILGADNKAAVAVIVEVARRLARDGSPVGVELLFTTTEELALKGAKAFDQSQLRSEYGFVFDHATPIGEIVIAAPTYYRIDASFHGHAAHAGIRPEDGHNAIAAAAAGIAQLELGRIDRETTANVGVIQGGTAGNVVAERCDVLLETRSLDHDRAHASATRIVDCLTAAAADSECDVAIDVEEQFRGFKLPKTAPAVVAAAEALTANGFEPRYISTGGGSDANAFIARGLTVVNLANGTERNHEPEERVAVAALEQMLDVTLALVHASAR
jgi:tripeptide aminopeptidase